MFEAHLALSSTMKKILDSIKDLTNAATFDCSDSGIQLQAMDNSHVSLVSLILPSEEFDLFHCDRDFSMDMNLKSLAKILNCADNEDKLIMKAQENADTIKFIFESKVHEKVSGYELKLMNLNGENLEIPESDYSCVVRMPSIEFARICRNLSQFGENIKIACTEEGIKFSATGDEVAEAYVKLTKSPLIDDDSEGMVIIETQQPVSLTVGCRYLNLFTKATPLSTQVKISLSDDLPLVVRYDIGNYGHIQYYLAPRIEDA